MGKWTKQNFLKRRNSNSQKHIKKCSPSLAIKEMQNKTTIRFHLTPVRIAIISNTTNNSCWWGFREIGALLHCWWEWKQVQPLWKKIWRLLKKLNIDLPFDPAIPLLGIYPKDCDTGYSRSTCTLIFIAALLTIAKLWKQPRCPTTDEWIEKIWYLYTMEFYAAMKKNEMLSFAGTWMELEKFILSDVSLAQKTKTHMFSLICGH
jgi:hypothetical protein